MNKTFISFIFALLPIMVSADESGICGKNLTWSFVEATNTLTISGRGAMSDYSYIGDSPWSYNKSIHNVIIESGVTYIGCFAFQACSGLTSITIPSSVKSIGGSAFKYCSGLSLITIPSSVTSIGRFAFSGCRSLTSITIPKSVSSIGESVFEQCICLTSIDVEVGNKSYDSRNNCNAIIETETNTLITGCKNTIIPSSVTSIGKKAFYYCRSLSSMTIPWGVRIIGEQAFELCEDLTSINIPSSVTSISRYAFTGCSRLKSITIPNSVTSIEDYAFSGCIRLTSITIPNSVRSIGEKAFAFQGIQLEDVYCYAEQVPSTYSNAFEDTSLKYCKLHVPAASVDAYKAVAPWRNFKEVVALTEQELSVDGITCESKSEEARYTMGGQRANKNTKGLYIIRMGDGATKKVVAK